MHAPLELVMQRRESSILLLIAKITTSAPSTIAIQARDVKQLKNSSLKTVLVNLPDAKEMLSASNIWV
jgi:hypothetical protein